MSGISERAQTFVKRRAAKHALHTTKKSVRNFPDAEQVLKHQKIRELLFILAHHETSGRNLTSENTEGFPKLTYHCLSRGSC